jgi:methylated-DNA-protein-cysteine methyltransferase-like protein
MAMPKQANQLKKLQPSGKPESPFFQQVYDIVEQVPKGKVTTYGAIAKALGSGLSARMVGWALNAAHTDGRTIPAQRVVNRNGQLSGKGHFSTPTRMQELLEKDGLIIENDTVKDFRTHFWDPATELEA